MARTLTQAERDELLRSFDHAAFRLELQPTYALPYEQDTLAKFLAGDPEPPDAAPGLRAWFEQVAGLAAEGKRIERVRVHDDPPTPYQRWARWTDSWSARAGETIRYMTRPRAHEVGLLPDSGPADWWLLDSRRLVVMRFDDEGRRVEMTLAVDPAIVVQACAWRDLAIRHSTVGGSDDAAV